MALVGHLVGIDQLGYEKELGMTPSVSIWFRYIRYIVGLVIDARRQNSQTQMRTRD